MKKRFIYVFALALSALSLQCDQLVNSELKPDSKERGIDYKIILNDESGTMQKLTGKNIVCNALIHIKSNTLGTEYTAITDSNGVAAFHDIISDDYHISASRDLSADEMEQVSGHKVSGYKLLNRKCGVIKLLANNTVPIEVSMESVFAGSPIVISEIYASGPQGSGSYYHDKYVELFNQSDSVQYLDGLVIARVYSSETYGINYRKDPEFIHSEVVWNFPGNGKDYPIMPGQYIVCAEDAIDHRINAPKSIDLSHSNFEFFKDDAPDVDNQAVTNMVRFYQPLGNDWLIGGERDALVLARIPAKSLAIKGSQYLIPYSSILDGVEYLKDPTMLDKKTLNDAIDAGAAGGIQFYTGKSMERISVTVGGKTQLLDNNNSSLDFKIIDHPTPGYHF
jgi:hypothetical protein